MDWGKGGFSSGSVPPLEKTNLAILLFGAVWSLSDLRKGRTGLLSIERE